MMRNEMTKCVIFDLDQTIVDHRKGEAAGLQKIYELFWKDKVEDFQYLYDDFTRINMELWSNLKNGDYDAGFIINNRFKYLTKLYDLENQAEVIKKIYSAQYISHCTPFGGVQLLLEKLYKANIPMVIGSNGFHDCQTKKLKQHRLKKYFFKCYYGNKAPFCKPCQYFFQYIIKDIGVKAGEILFVGDSMKDDIYPAIEAGMKTLHLDHHYLDRGNLAYEKVLAYIRNMIYAS